MEDFKYFPQLLVLGLGEILSALQTTLTISEKEKYVITVIDSGDKCPILQIKHPSGWVNGFVMTINGDEDATITSTIAQNGDAWQVVEKNDQARLLHTASNSKQTELPLLQQQNGNWSLNTSPLAMAMEDTDICGLNRYGIWTEEGKKVASFATSPLSMSLVFHPGNFKLRFDYPVQA